MTPSAVLKSLLCKDIHLFLSLSSQSYLTGFGTSKHISVTVSATEPRTPWTNKQNYELLPYVCSKDLALSGSRTFIVEKRVECSARSKMYLVLDKTDILKTSTMYHKTKSIKIFSEYCIQNYPIPNVLMLQKLFFTNLLNSFNLMYST